MAIHVAILKRAYLELILAGRKTVESRLSKVDGPPHGRVQPGERLFFKASGGPFLATALADAVEDHADLAPAGVEALCERWNPAVGGDADYWELKSASRYATFIRLRDIEVLHVGPRYQPQNMRAWYVLPEVQSPLVDVTLTAGAIRNRYLPLPKRWADARPTAYTLHLPDGERIDTERADRGRMLRWRGWGRHYTAFGLEAGDTVRLIQTGPSDYAVRFRRRPRTLDC